MILWDDLRFLLAAHQAGSHAGAARALGVDATTVGRRLAALEREAGAPLLVRTPDGLSATDEGLRLIEAAARMAEEVGSAARALSGRDGRLEGVVRLTAGEGVMSRVLAPALVGFRERHPGLELELLADSRSLDLSRREADVAVRLYRPREPDLVASRLGELPYGIYGSRGYLEQRGRPRKASDLASHDFVTFDARLEGVPEMRWLEKTVPAARRVVRTNSTSTLIGACAAGHGLALLATAFAAGEPRLERVLPKEPVPSRELWSATHADLRKAARVDALVSFLREALG